MNTTASHEKGYSSTIGFIDYGTNPEDHEFTQVRRSFPFDRLFKTHRIYRRDENGGGSLHLLEFPEFVEGAREQTTLGAEEPYEKGKLCVLAAINGTSESLYANATRELGLHEAEGIKGMPDFSDIMERLARRLISEQ